MEEGRRWRRERERERGKKKGSRGERACKEERDIGREIEAEKSGEIRRDSRREN